MSLQLQLFKYLSGNFTDFDNNTIYVQAELSSKEKSILQSWQKGDMMLYNHFKEKFDSMVSQNFKLYVKISNDIMGFSDKRLWL